MRPAEVLLRSLGITDPADIDVEAIAYDQGAVVRFRPLRGCAARIVGHGDRAIITVNDRDGPARRRFSAAHELGHWHHHRGHTFICRPEDIGRLPADSPDPERVADAYAADLLLPPYLFIPRCDALDELTFESIVALSRDFSTSVTATALRMVELGPEPAMLVCHDRNGRRWFFRPPHIPRRWFPRDELDISSPARDTLNGGARVGRRQRVGAEIWFDTHNADHHEIFEQSFRTATGEILTILVFRDYEMLDGAASRCRNVPIR